MSGNHKLSLCQCGAWMINDNAGRRWMKISKQWKYAMRCPRCNAREVIYVSPTGQIQERGARPTGRPYSFALGVSDQQSCAA